MFQQIREKLITDGFVNSKRVSGLYTFSHFDRVLQVSISEDNQEVVVSSFGMNSTEEVSNSVFCEVVPKEKFDLIDTVIELATKAAQDYTFKKQAEAQHEKRA